MSGLESRIESLIGKRQYAEALALLAAEADRKGELSGRLKRLRRTLLSKRRRRALRAQIEALIRRREYVRALRVIAKVEADEHDRDAELSLRLKQLQGLALARRGSWKQAQEKLGALYEAGELDSETAGMYARTWMDRYDKSCKRADLRRSRDLYLEAFERYPNDNYTGVNAAAKSVLLGELDVAREIASRVEQLPAVRARRRYWPCATAAEVQLIYGNYERAATLYRRAVLLDPDAFGSHDTTWLQAKRLMTAMRTPDDDRVRIERAFAHLRDQAPGAAVVQPPFRRIRVFAFDPSVSRGMETAMINEVTLRIPWEVGLEKGPVGEYLEVVDYDPASGCFYPPVDLNQQSLLATDGIPPSEGDPGFHQQMVYAIGMNVIDAFERALGRRALWSSRQRRDADGKVTDEQFVRRLRIYPHALREANAYYSPDKKALLFGYFPAEVEEDPKVLPGGTVFSALSHDVIAHEMSHALLDGLHPRFAEPSNKDVLAFHEAFADIVALFQHFSHPQVLRHEIARTRGDLGSENLLGQLAQQFGRAIGKHGALRHALGEIDPVTKQWRPAEPDPAALRTTDEPHARGAILMAAVFDAFLAIYRARSADLKRIATQGSGILEPGAVHPDLAARLAREAAKSASHVLQICIRALDYCPPVDLTFGDYLRAIITADVDVVPDDRRNYRLAFVEAFQRRGIYPADVRNLSVESLVWRPPRGNGVDVRPLFEVGGDGEQALSPDWPPLTDREALWRATRERALLVHEWLMEHCSSPEADELGLALAADAPRSVYREANKPTAEVHSVRLARRNTPRGGQQTDFVIEILQRRRGYFDRKRQQSVDRARRNPPGADEADFVFRGGCTLLIDPATCEVRYAITKHILSGVRLERQRTFMTGQSTALRATYFGDPGRDGPAREPFAALHRPFEPGDEQP